MRAAVIECGLEPVELDDLAGQIALDSDPSSEAGAVPNLLILVTDRNPAASPSAVPSLPELRSGIWPQKIFIGAAGQDPGRKPDSLFAWTFQRPLSLQAIVPELRQAIHAAGVVARQQTALIGRILLSQSIFRSLSNGVTLCDVTLPDLPLVYVNPAFERMTGYSAQETCGHNCRFLQGSDIDQPGINLLREGIRNRRDTHALLRNYRKDGTPFWNELYISPVFDAAGALTHIAGFQNDVTLRVEAQTRLEDLANHDSLTGLARREWMMEQLHLAIARARRNGSRIAVLFFDLNHFKKINDTFGHAVGDTVLCVVADRLRRGTRASEVIARIGGDEFVIVLENIVSDEHARKGMERLCALVGGDLDVDGQLFQPSASVGMATYPQDGDTPTQLLKMADANMYLAKMQHHESSRVGSSRDASDRADPTRRR
jgi:diguanylate cyclase (GGDEF)-like protein/PAS domain S-box-containing protein